MKSGLLFQNDWLTYILHSIYHLWETGEIIFLFSSFSVLCLKSFVPPPAWYHYRYHHHHQNHQSTTTVTTTVALITAVFHSDAFSSATAASHHFHHSHHNHRHYCHCCLYYRCHVLCHCPVGWPVYDEMGKLKPMLRSEAKHCLSR